VRILVLNWQDRLNPQAGGAETHVHELFGRLASRGHGVTLLASGWKGSTPREWVDGIDVHRAGTRYTYGLAAPRYYRAALASAKFDVVVEALNKVPVFSPLWAGAPRVLLVHHLFGATAFREASFPVAALTWLLERPLPRVYRGVPVQAISRSTADDLVERGLRPGSIRVIYPGVDLDFFTPGDPGSRAARPSFLYLGRLKRYKGVEIVLEALARLDGEAKEGRLVIAGKGEWEPALREAARRLGIDGRVEFKGFVSEERKRDLMRAAWANVFPSPKEGWGITNLEAAACGTPTVASDSPGLRESVVDGTTGLLVPHGDAARLAAAMRSLAASPGRVEEMGVAGRAFAQGFTWERTADETERHLQEVVSGARGAGPAAGHLSA
jgi:glycosyltransferase involved in cell wall biosynthesis